MLIDRGFLYVSSAIFFVRQEITLSRNKEECAVDLDLDGLESKTEVTDRSTFTSKSTGSQLERIKVEIVVRGSDSNERLIDIIAKGKEEGINSVDKQGNAEKKWKIVDSSYHYGYTNSETEANADYYHYLELEETEVLKLESLEIGGLKLEPYVYEEEFEDKYLLINPATVRVQGEANVKLKNMIEADDYYPVARIGIDSTPRKMRFGKVLWSEHGAKTKYRLVLVEKAYDEVQKPTQPLKEPQFSNMEKIVSRDSELIKQLLAVLSRRGILAAEEVEEIKTKSQENVANTLRLFTRVKDVDEW